MFVCQTAAFADGNRARHCDGEEAVRSLAPVPCLTFLLVRTRQRLHWLRHALPDIRAQRTDVLAPRMVRILEDLAQDWRRPDDRIAAVTDEIDALSKNTEPCRHLMTIPGIGPISAVVAALKDFNFPRLNPFGRTSQLSLRRSELPPLQRPSTETESTRSECGRPPENPRHAKGSP